MISAFSLDFSLYFIDFMRKTSPWRTIQIREVIPDIERSWIDPLNYFRLRNFHETDFDSRNTHHFQVVA